MPQSSSSEPESTATSGAIGPARPEDRWGITLTEADSVLESLWNEDAVVWEKYWVPVFRLFAKDLVRIASPSSKDVVLDLGTGSGIAAIEICRAVRSVGVVVGIDRSEAMITLARRKAIKVGFHNAKFIKMRGEELHFPDGFFDLAISNCGIAISDVGSGLKEILRVLTPGGVLVFNDWHLIDVKPHRIFGEVLSRHRTGTPSPELARERSALARMESFHRSLSSQRQLEMVLDAGFGKAYLRNRRYRVHMKGIRDYVQMRLCRATIRREISEMSAAERRLFLSDLREGLQRFVKGSSFVFDWNVYYINAKKTARQPQNPCNS